jgi:hypothetical protein
MHLLNAIPFKHPRETGINYPGICHRHGNNHDNAGWIGILHIKYMEQN